MAGSSPDGRVTAPEDMAAILPVRGERMRFTVPVSEPDGTQRPRPRPGPPGADDPPLEQYHEPRPQPPYGQHAYPQQPYGQQAYPPPTYGYGYAQPYGYRSPSNGLGLAGMITGIVGVVLTIFFIGIIPSILGLIFGLIGHRKVRRGEATNGGQALTGIITGSVGIALFIAYVSLLIAVGHSSGCVGSGCTV